ncbi:MAG: hypothetical protein HKM89_14175 [Gemmatimonadales bacterium]|nr:hypothetical protein [Gemmatimonadales bacterium]
MAKELLHTIAFVAVVGGIVSACDDPTALPDATVPNVIDTVSLFALDGTPVTAASGYSIPDGRPVRTDQRPDFDFAFNFGPGDVPWLLPPGALGLAQELSLEPGILEPSNDFDDITIAQLNGYRTSDTVAVSIGQTFLARSRIACGLGVPVYMKLRVLAFDLVARSITFEALANRNCGYRGLRPGLPDD